MGAEDSWPHVLNLGNSIIGVTVLAMPFCFQQVKRENRGFNTQSLALIAVLCRAHLNSKGREFNILCFAHLH